MALSFWSEHVNFLVQFYRLVEMTYYQLYNSPFEFCPPPTLDNDFKCGTIDKVQQWMIPSAISLVL
jgi:hypothetical protein